MFVSYIVCLISIDFFSGLSAISYYMEFKPFTFRRGINFLVLRDYEFYYNSIAFSPFLRSSIKSSSSSKPTDMRIRLSVIPTAALCSAGTAA